ncbi:protein jag [Spirulina subsalsa]|uniref:Jag family protein n=1 Tax=Spirulina subsalsa TaxID=54311 RepID=UPI0003629E3C|nr:R3H domain-containing nucleic acid-binding protein [Spirulina subsalsa]
MQERMERGQAWLAELLKLMGCPTNVTVSHHEGDESIWLMVEESQLSEDKINTLIGEQGKTIDAIQYLANTILNIGVDRADQHPYTIEIHGYRVKRQGELRVLVDEVAEQVRATGQEVEMTSLSSAERRQIHNFFQELEELSDLTTESRGSEPNRRMFVRLR